MNKPIVVLHLETRNSGGAHDYTFNIHNNMLSAGYHSYLAIYGSVILSPNGTEIAVAKKKIPVMERVRRKIHETFIKKMKPYVDPKYCAANLTERITLFNVKDLLAVLPEKPDYIFVHWVSGYATAKYVSELQRLTGAKVYYLMIDEAILSGACHYPWDCNGYQNGCRNCKITDSCILKWFIRKNYIFKERYLVKDKNVIYPSTFDLIRLQKSSLWKGAKTLKLLEAVDETLFCPADKVEPLFKKFNIPYGKRVIFFGCSDLKEERKGMTKLIEALNLLERSDIVLLTAGRDELPPLRHEAIVLGHLDMKTLAQAYQVADVYVCPSLEDSGPQMINMALMTGVPVVSFEVGEALDIVITGKTGYRAKFCDVEDLAHGLNYVLDLSMDEYHRMKKYCRKMALEEFSFRSQMDFFKQLFEKDKR